MRIISVLFGLVIFLCVVTVSFSHTVALYERVGFVQWEAILITCAVETTFLLSAWTILWYRNKGQKPGGPAYAGFLYGIVIVLFSNAAYTVGLDILFKYKIAQWALALSVVFGVLVSEAIISRNLVMLSEQKNSVQRKRAVQTVQYGFLKRIWNSIKLNAKTEQPEQTEQVAQVEQIERTEQPKQVEQVQSVQPVQPNKQKTNRRRVQKSEQNNEQVDEQIYEVVRKKALEVYEQTGRVPGRPKLKELTGFSDRQLLPIVRKLKQELAG